MAFTRDEFINIDLSSTSYGQNDPHEFEQLMMGEYNALEYSLSGMEVMDNFNYKIDEN